MRHKLLPRPKNLPVLSLHNRNQDSQTFQWSRRNSKFSAPKLWNVTLFTPQPTQFRHHGTTFSLAGCPGARYLRTRSPDNTHQAELLGADTLRRTMQTPPKKNLTICLKTPTCTSYLPPIPQKNLIGSWDLGFSRRPLRKQSSEMCIRLGEIYRLRHQGTQAEALQILPEYTASHPRSFLPYSLHHGMFFTRLQPPLHRSLTHASYACSLTL
jgi:hypothetical protein